MAAAASVSPSDPRFWTRPAAARAHDFKILRDGDPVSWQPPPIAWSSPQYPDTTGYWAVTRHADVMRVSRAAEQFRSGSGISWFAAVPQSISAVWEGFIGLDAPEHRLLRSTVAPAFKRKSVAELRPLVRRHVHSALGAVSDVGSQDLDFLHDVVGPIPVGIICELMGVPASDTQFLFGLMDTMNGTGATLTTFDDSLQAAREMSRYAVELAAHKRKHPGDDVTSQMVQATIDGRSMDADEIGGTFVVVVTGGMDTMSNTAAHAMVGFDEFPDQWATLHQQRAGVSLRAMDEMLRWATPVRQFRRTASFDTTIQDQTIRAGDSVVMWFESANRDEAVFDHPESFDLDRQPNPHLAFGGGGPHFCLGAHLAYLQLDEFFRELAVRYPRIHLTAEPEYADSPFINTFRSLRCRMT